MYLHGIGATYHTYENTTICFIGLNWEILCTTENVSLPKATNLYMLTLKENLAMQGHLPDTLNFHFAASHRKNSLSNKSFVSIISTGYLSSLQRYTECMLQLYNWFGLVEMNQGT